MTGTSGSERRTRRSGGRAGPALGRDFGLLWGAYGASNLADGILLAAGPLLVTTLTRDPLLVSLATAVQLAPTFLFSLLVGVAVDRADRRRLQWVAHAVRAVVLAAVAAAIAVDSLSLPLLYAALFALGTAEVVADTGGETLVAAVVPRADLGTAMSRLVGTSSVTNRLAGPPLGAALFGVGLAVPYATNAVLLAAAAVLVSRLSTDGRASTVDRDAGSVGGGTDGPRAVEELASGVGGDPPEDGRGSAGGSAPHLTGTAGAAAFGEDDAATRRGGLAGVWAEVVEGWRLTVHTPPVRRLVVLITVFNLTFGATYGILVLWALERLGLGEVGYGALLTASAVGGLVGSALFPALERRFSYGTLLRAGLVVESSAHFLLGATTSPWFAGAVLVAFGVHEAVWGSLSGAIRLKLVPDHALGRVNSVYRLAIIAPLLVGVSLGGVLADSFGILAPFWYAGVGASVTTLVVWRSMADLGSAAEDADDEDGTGDAGAPAEDGPAR